tara:strand:+ start:1202 stop:1789 length:588 start_codon:yes stop_codon:yes gene_type:complete
MIKFNNLNQDAPYLMFRKKYDESLTANQINVEAICIASFSDEVNARFVNLKFINNNEFIFFSNYNSPKSRDFSVNNQITALIYWNSINIQIRMKAYIQKTSTDFNNEYFSKRDKKKNALAISSNQSEKIGSYQDVSKNFEKTLKKNQLSECPDYWGGYSFIPYYFEFWEGHESRLNKREVFEMSKDGWNNYIIQP